MSTLCVRKNWILDTHGQGKRVKIPLLPNNEGKKSANDTEPQQGHNMFHPLFIFYSHIWLGHKANHKEIFIIKSRDE